MAMSCPQLSEFKISAYSNKLFEAFKTIKEIRKYYSEIADTVEITDLGAGSHLTPKVSRRIADVAANSSMKPFYGEIIYNLIEQMKPQTILELGTSLGIGTLYLSKHDYMPNVITIEGCPAIGALAKQTFSKANASNIKQIIGNFDIMLMGTLSAINEIDFAFIDGNHREEPTLRYFESILKKSHANTVFVFDDIYWSPGMENAWKKIKSHPAVGFSIDLYFMGFIFLNKSHPVKHYKIRI